MAQGVPPHRRRLPPELVRAYLQAWYVAEPTPGWPASVVFHIGVGNRTLAQRLSGHHRAGFVTACHPHGQSRSYRQECADRGALAEMIDASGLERQPATGRDPKGSFPSEPGFLVLGADCDRLAAWAAACGQDAFVSIEKPPGSEFAWARLVLLYPIELRLTEDFLKWCNAPGAPSRAADCTLKERVRLSLMQTDERRAALLKSGPVKLPTIRLKRVPH